MKRRKSQLSLNRSTIRNLVSSELEAAEGAGRNAWGCYEHRSVTSVQTEGNGCTVVQCRAEIL